MADFESLEAIAQTDALLDAIAGERRFTPDDRDEQALVALLEGWRDDVRRHSADEVVTEQEAVSALRSGLTERPEKKPSHRRGLTLVTSVAAAVLAIGGFGAVVMGSEPGDSLYGVRTALFGDRGTVRDDRVALAAQTQMAEVQQMIDQGDWEQAQQKLAAVSTQVQSVDDVGTKTDLIQQWNELSVKVGTRDAAATLPPSVEGEPAAPPPAGVTLLELPPATTTTDVTTTSESGTATTDTGTSSAAETTTSGETTTSAPTTTPTSGTTSTGVPTTTTSPPPTTSVETTQAPTTTTAAPPTSTPTQVPTTSAPTTTVQTTQAPTTAAQTTAAQTTTAQPQTATSEAATSEAPTSQAPTTQAPAATTTAPVVEQAPARQQETTAVEAEVVPTTTTVPAPAG